jgi:hypothetical protein
MSMWEDKFTNQLKDRVRSRAAELGTGSTREIETGWTSLLAELRAAMEKGTDPASPEVRSLVIRMRGLTRRFSGGDAAVEEILTEAYRSGAGAPHGVDGALMDYIARAARP